MGTKRGYCSEIWLFTHIILFWMPFELNWNHFACHTIKFPTRWAVVVMFIAAYYKEYLNVADC